MKVFAWCVISVISSVVLAPGPIALGGDAAVRTFCFVEDFFEDTVRVLEFAAYVREAIGDIRAYFEGGGIGHAAGQEISLKHFIFSPFEQ